MITINYKYQEGWETSAFNINKLSQNEEEKEVIFPSFSFFKIKNIVIDFEKFVANIELKNIGEKTLLEKVIQEDKIISYNKSENIMEENNQKNYPNDINAILKKEYPWLNFVINLDEEKEDQKEQI